MNSAESPSLITPHAYNAPRVGRTKKEGKRHRDRWPKHALEVMVERLAIWLYDEDAEGSDWFRESSTGTRTHYLRKAKAAMEAVLGIEIGMEL